MRRRRDERESCRSGSSSDSTGSETWRSVVVPHCDDGGVESESDSEPSGGLVRELKTAEEDATSSPAPRRAVETD